MISPRPVQAALAGLGLGIGLFVLFKVILGLGLVAFPRAWM
jgi:putative tricarboxylic transport membrane protein